MNRNITSAGLGLVAAAGLTLAGVATASAHGSGHGDSTSGHAEGRVTTVFNLDELNHSDVNGVALVRLDGNEAHVKIYANGLLADHPHAQHFHVGAQGECPSQDADTDGDGIVSTTEGHPFYGHIGTSLTTTGDTSADSGLAIDRFPTAPDEKVRYERTVEVTDEVAAELRDGNAVVVLHGIDPDGSGTYDGDAPSDLDPSLPLEATSPAACGDQSVVLGGWSGLGLDLDLDLDL